MAFVLAIDGIDVGEHIPSDKYSIQYAAEGGENEFTAVNGDIVGGSAGGRIALAFSLRSVPREKAQRISAALSGGVFPCTYEAPHVRTDRFKAESFTVNPKNHMTLLDFEVNIKTACLINSGDGL